MEFGTKIWLLMEGRSALGAGRVELLKMIDREGSIAGAAKKLDMSFRRAWNAVERAEEGLGVKLLERRKGGAGGGRSNLTPFARDLVARFDRLRLDTGEFAARRFDTLFGQERSAGESVGGGRPEGGAGRTGRGP